MKTEPTEALKELIRCVFDAYDIEGEDIENIVRYDIAKDTAMKAFKEGQSSPKIKQLEWVKIDEDEVKGIQAKTLFGDYDMYERIGHSGSILWGFDQEPYVFDTEIEAKIYAQADFERRVMECLDL